MSIAQRFVALSLVLEIALAGEAKAYLDPGTGSAILQMALAGLVGALFVLKTYWRKFTALLTGKSETDEPASDEPPRPGH